MRCQWCGNISNSVVWQSANVPNFCLHSAKRTTHVSGSMLPQVSEVGLSAFLFMWLSCDYTLGGLNLVHSVWDIVISHLNIKTSFWNGADKHVSTSIVHLTFQSEIIVISNGTHTVAYCVFGLFYDPVNISGYIVSDDILNSEWWIWKDLEGG